MDFSVYLRGNKPKEKNVVSFESRKKQNPIKSNKIIYSYLVHCEF